MLQIVFFAALVLVGLIGEMACAQLSAHLVEQVNDALDVEMALADGSE